jgi:hypothetical protein
MRTRQRYGYPGSVSHGTTRPEDLIPTFLDVLDDLRLTRADRNKVRKLRSEWNACTDDEFCKVHKSADGVECGDQIGYLLNEELFDLLNAYAPPYFYFGAHESDGADYGFWLSEDSLSEDERDGQVWRDPDDGTRMPAEASYRLVVSDHGNMTLYTRRDREVWGLV